MECLCGTEHLLLSLLKETDCVATRLLFTMGVNIQKLFAAILTAMGFDNDTIAEEFPVSYTHLDVYKRQVEIEEYDTEE